MIRRGRANPGVLRNLLAMVAYGFAHPLPQPGRHPAAITYYGDDDA